MTERINQIRQQLTKELQIIQSELAQAKLAVDLFSKKEVELKTRLNGLDALDQPESTVVDPVAV